MNRPMNTAGESFLLRIEGVNLYQVLGDTNQVSVIRGASMALRDVIGRIVGWLRDAKVPSEAIQTGASVGLFRLDTDGATARACRGDIAERLNRDPLYRHFTFVADIQPMGDFAQDREKVLAKNRFRQLRQATVAIPPPNESLHKLPCEVDGLRPATTRAPVKGTSKPVSASIRKRFCHGVLKKRFFIRDETGLDERSFRFTRDLAEIAVDKNYGGLNGKVAFVYVDGNGFGKMAGEAADQKANPRDKIRTYREWDEYIQERRRTFLREFIVDALNQAGFVSDKRRLRLEVLLWGGDEILLVVPAWQGFHTLNAFYRASAGWEFGDALTHAGGIVFCHHKTPIFRVSELAKKLADRVKETPSGRKKNLFDYLVLESIDYPAESLDCFFDRRYGASLVSGRSPLAPVSEWESLTKWLPDSVLALPKSQVYAMARAALQSPQAFRHRLARLREITAPALRVRAEDDLRALFGGGDEIWPWLHLVELWDYLAPQHKENPAGNRDA